jgi:Kef-type K+ transport system membrane component KefB
MAAAVFGVPFLAGLGVAFWLYGDHQVVEGVAVDRPAFVLFVAAAISITAFPVLARIIEEHGLVGTPVGALAVSCAAVNDVLSWIALALALGIGLSAGLLDSSLYAVLVVMAVVTTVATSPALRALGAPRAR